MNEAERQRFEADLAAISRARPESVFDDPEWIRADNARFLRGKRLSEEMARTGRDPFLSLAEQEVER